MPATLTPRRTRKKAAPSPHVSPHPEPRELRLDAADHVVWARAIARGVRADYSFLERSHEEEELEGVALATLVRLIDRFDEGRLPARGDLAKAFRGACSVAIRSECRRAAEQLRNGGLYRTRQGGAIRVTGLPVNAEGENEVTDPVSLEEEPESWVMAMEPQFRTRKAAPNAVAAAGDTRARFAAYRAKLK